MSLTVRDADLAADRQALIGTLQENLPRLRHDVRFGWLYLNNPFGEARAFLLEAGEPPAVVGCASVFPRPMYMGSKRLVVGQVGDFAINPAFRSLGPAILLQKATLQPVRTQQMLFCYDTPPGDLGMAPFKRMGMSPQGRLVRFAKLLRVDRKVEGLAGKGLAAKGLSSFGNAALRIMSRGQSQKAGYDISLFMDRFGPEFSELDASLTEERYTFRTERSAEYLNWRYRNDPLRRYEVVTARTRGRLEGYCIISREDDAALIVDVFGKEGGLGPLLQWTSEFLREHSASTLHAVSFEGGLQAKVLKNAGFSLREKSHSVVFWPDPRVQENDFRDRPDRWMMTFGDVSI
jgi:hypothetical protein